MEWHRQGLREIAQAIRSRKISAVEMLQYFQKREQQHRNLNAFVSLNPRAEEQALAIDAAIARGENPGVLAGVPVGIKDLICAAELRTTAGSKMLENFVPTYDATLVARLKAAGAIVFGKQNLDEFAMGSSNETSFFGPVRNPWDANRVPGGSSGGSAAAQAAGLVAASIGTDTGGSIRQPASFCGVVGLKPTYGRVSRYGVIAYASSLDQAGPMTSTVADARLIYETIAGHDPFDATTSRRPVLDQQNKTSGKPLRVGIVREFSGDGLSPATAKAFSQSIEALKSQGAQVTEVSIPLTQLSIAVYYLISASEASSNLARYDGVRYGHRAEFEDFSAVDLASFYAKSRGEGFGHEVKRRLILGTYALSAGYQDQYYVKACQVRRLLAQEFAKAFESCDVLISPVTTAPAFRLGEKISDPMQMYLNDVFTTSANLAGIPAMSVPFALDENRLPIGIQLMANHFAESELFAAGTVLEQHAPNSGARPC